MSKPNLKQKLREWGRIQRELKEKQKKPKSLNGGEGSVDKGERRKLV